MTAMQEQITSLTTAVHALTQNTLVSTATALPRSDVASQRPFRRHSSIKEKESVFQGPTTSAYSLDLAKSSLQRRGIVEEHPDVADAEDGDVDGDEGDTAPSQVIPMAVAASPPRTRHYPSGDPLWTIGKSEALRLCRVYEEEMGIMYPVLELPQLLHQVELLYGAESWPRVPVAQGNEEQLDRTAVHILRLVFACALTAEAAGSSALALSLFESVREVADNFVWGVAGIKNIIFLTLVVSTPMPYIRKYVLLVVGHLLLSNRRRNPRLAYHRHRRAHVSRTRPSPPRNPQPAIHSQSRQRPRPPTLLVDLHSRHPLEFWHGHALLP